MNLPSPIKTLFSKTRHLSYPDDAEPYARKMSDIIVLGVGTSRLVVTTTDKNIAVKISYNPQPLANRKEAHIYSNASDSLQQNLLPIYDTGENCQYVICPYIPNISTGLKRFEGPCAKSLYNRITAQGFDIYEIETTRHNGTILAIDYGS